MKVQAFSQKLKSLKIFARSRWFFLWKKNQCEHLKYSTYKILKHQYISISLCWRWFWTAQRNSSERKNKILKMTNYHRDVRPGIWRILKRQRRESPKWRLVVAWQFWGRRKTGRVSRRQSVITDLPSRISVCHHRTKRRRENKQICRAEAHGFQTKMPTAAFAVALPNRGSRRWVYYF